MPFDNGKVTFTVCRMPQALPRDIVQRLAERKASPLKSVKEVAQVGWVGWRHLLDTQIDDLSCYLGGYLHVYMRVAQRKIPASLLRAACRMEEMAMQQAMNTTVLSKKQKREIKDKVTDDLLKEMPPSLTGIPIVCDPATETMYVGAASNSQIDKVLTFFYETAMFDPVPLTPEIIAEEYLGNMRAPQLPSLHFTPRKECRDEQPVLGRDFATWLWFFLDTIGGTFDVPGLGLFGIGIDGPLTFAADSVGAHESSVRKGLPTLSAEAKAALMSGKKLKSAKFMFARDRETWEFVLDADNFAFRGMTMPAGEEMEIGSHFQERILSLNHFRRAFMTLFEKFLDNFRDSETTAKLQAELIKWAENIETQ